jgi:hypothetical protein
MSNFIFNIIKTVFFGHTSIGEIFTAVGINSFYAYVDTASGQGLLPSSVAWETVDFRFAACSRLMSSAFLPFAGSRIFLRMHYINSMEVRKN